MNKKTLCIYHGNCADGFGAAWVVRHALGADNVEFFSAVHQNPPPDVAGRAVIMVDFCYKRDVMLLLAKAAESILVLDHHKSAMEDMQYSGGDMIFNANPFRVDWEGYAENLHPEIVAQPSLVLSSFPDFSLVNPIGGIAPHQVTCVFDMNRSGAGLTWDFFNPGVLRPKLIDHIEDRDLWRFKLDGTREIQAALFSYPYDFEEWDRLMKASVDGLFNDGIALERKHHKDIAELVQVVTRPMKFRAPRERLAEDFPLLNPQDFHPHEPYVVVPAANLPYTMTSDAGHLLCEDHGLTGKLHEFHGFPFAACYWITPEGVVFSLRSRDDGADVSAIAKLYGGGGHAHAAGFRIPFDRLLEMLV